ncbi:insulin-degrading enzyme-like protein [Trifolium pratense]|uniref:Insulin-degrading enzyme-like protein n=1 Tax=Trifolium pratense TaxID=57577 RepID=A0A2K3NEY9_TRIPR|nr:insulin-degrading enzyme-like protein [Trifolium pratense]
MGLKGAPAAATLSSSDDVVLKSPNDSRLYRLIHLENGLQALLVHDPEIYPEGPPKTETIEEDEEEEEDDEEDEEDGMDDDDDEEEEDEEDEEEDGMDDDDEDVDGREGGKAAANQSKKLFFVVLMGNSRNGVRGMMGSRLCVKMYSCRGDSKTVTVKESIIGRESLNMSRDNPHLTSRFCKIELARTPNSKMVSESSLRFVGLSAIRFSLSDQLPMLVVLGAAAAMCVGIGSFSDPNEAQGLAHFLEHMLFMGSDEFPDENENFNIDWDEFD